MASLGEPASEEALFELRYDLLGVRRPLVILPRIASMVGALGALYQALWLLGSDHGLDGLVAGLPERLAIARALSSAGWGLGTWILGALGALAVDPPLRAMLESTKEGMDAFS